MTRTPISIVLADNGLGIVLTANQSVISGTDIMAANEIFLEHHAADFPKCRYWYCDYSTVEVTDITVGDLVKLGEMHTQAAHYNANLLVAVYAPEDWKATISKIWEEFAKKSGWKTLTCQNEEEAKNWLRTELGRNLTFV